MTQSVNCPGCKQQITIDDSPQQNELNELRTQLQKTSKISSSLPGYTCTNCNDIHSNPNYTKTPKGKCSNCDQYNPKSKGKCIWCKQDEVEEIDEDELSDKGITTQTNNDYNTHGY